MQLPAQLREAIAQLAQSADPSMLAQAATRLSERYRCGDINAPAMRTHEDRLAYAVTRMPATYAANRHVLEQVRNALGDVEIRSMLDLGAGMGAASWAAVEVFPTITQFALVERDPNVSAIGKEFAVHADVEELRNSTWVQADLSLYSATTNDLVVLSYAIGELTNREQEGVISAAWGAAAKALVIVEPGTQRGFENVLRARQALIAAGAQVAAPCPHHNVCPMAAVGDWCHLAQRVERTAEHRRLKAGELGHEDEKFSYVAAAKVDVQRPAARIVRHPLVRSGHIQLTLCTAEGLQRPTIGKSSKEKFRAARKAFWGAAWE